MPAAQEARFEIVVPASVGYPTDSSPLLSVMFSAFESTSVLMCVQKRCDLSRTSLQARKRAASVAAVLSKISVTRP